jgi:hypothetical protein
LANALASTQIVNHHQSQTTKEICERDALPTELYSSVLNDRQQDSLKGLLRTPRNEPFHFHHRRHRIFSLGKASGMQEVCRSTQSLSQRFKRFTSALRAGLSNFARNRTGEMLHVTAGFAFPTERPMFGGIAKKFQRLLRVVADSFQNLPESV